MTADYLVIGAGIVGINVSRELKRKFPHAKVVLLEKENECGEHASGRNSGVLHAGFYYTADSLKARFSRLGNKALTEYCDAKKLSIRKCGKLVVAQGPSDLQALDELFKRAKLNGVKVEEVSEDTISKIEPRAKTYRRALFSPTTSSVNPVQVTLAMKEDAIQEGVEVKTGVSYLGRNKQGKIKISTGEVSAGYVVNCAGLYADKIARDFGFSQNYRILPFRGLYLYSNEKPGSLQTHIYPVPDLLHPFLGVHFTVTVDGQVKIGPTAMSAFWREQYEGFSRFKTHEFFDILVRGTSLLLFSNFDFRKLAFEEMKKYSRAKLVALASHLVAELKLGDYTKWGRPGVRAQLMDIKKRKLEMDFVVEGDSRSMHVLNAVSPGFTCAIPFSEFVVQKILDHN